MNICQVIYYWRGDLYATRPISKRKALQFKSAFNFFGWQARIAIRKRGLELPTKGAIPANHEYLKGN